MTLTRETAPPAVLYYGLLGIVPFLAPALLGEVFPDVKDQAAHVLGLYGGLILSFLGGARWGFANLHRVPPTMVISLSMLPALVGVALLAVPPDARRLQLLGLAVALGAHWLWDIRAGGLPPWYPSLRTKLTVGAVAGLIAGAVVLT